MSLRIALIAAVVACSGTHAAKSSADSARLDPDFAPQRSAHLVLPVARSQADSGTTSRRWYGWQTLSLDAASLTIGAIGLSNRGEPGSTGIVMGSIGITGYALGAPLVHWAHGQPGKAASSLGLRIGLPLVPVGLLSATSAARCPKANEEDDANDCRLMLRTMAVVGTVGMLVASAVDAGALSWEPEVPQPGKLALAPLLGWDGARGGMAGLAGLF